MFTLDTWYWPLDTGHWSSCTVTIIPYCWQYSLQSSSCLQTYSRILLRIFSSPRFLLLSDSSVLDSRILLSIAQTWSPDTGWYRTTDCIVCTGCFVMNVLQLTTFITMLQVAVTPRGLQTSSSPSSSLLFSLSSLTLFNTPEVNTFHSTLFSWWCFIRILLLEIWTLLSQSCFNWLQLLIEANWLRLRQCEWEPKFLLESVIAEMLIVMSQSEQESLITVFTNKVLIWSQL